MRRRLSLCALLGVVLCLGLCLTPSLPAAGIASGGALQEEVLACVVHLEAGPWIGSGTVINHKGKVLILTAAHVVEDQVKPTVEEYTDKEGNVHKRENRKPRPVLFETRDGIRRKAAVVWYSDYTRNDQLDLALLEPESDAGLHAAPSAPVRRPQVLDLQEGDDVWYCGSGGGLKWSLDKSIINQLSDRYVTVNGNGWFGHSGSGLFVRRSGHYFLCGVVVQFALHPRGERGNPKSPIECERQIGKFLDGYPGK